jgi:hypothetical protein
VSDYGLNDRASGVRSPARAKDFSSILCVQTGSGAHPASSIMGTGGPFPGGKARPGRDADHSPPSSAEVVNEQELYLLSPPSASVACNGTALLLIVAFFQVAYNIGIRLGRLRKITESFYQIMVPGCNWLYPHYVSGLVLVQSDSENIQNIGCRSLYVHITSRNIL